MRIFYKTGSTIAELSNTLNKYASGTSTLDILSTDSFYIASDFPLNNFYVKVGTTPNIVTAAMNISYWSGNSFANAVFVNDYTDSFKNSGFVEFTPDKSAQWNSSNSNHSGQSIPELSTIIVYDKFWTKITFDADLTELLTLDWIGNLFSTDEDLFSEYPIFDDANYLASFKTGKTTWEEQAVRAAELIIADLIRKKVIVGREQILDRTKFIDASICKVAELIYNSFGNDYVEQRKAAKEEYMRRLDIEQYNVDLNGDAILDKREVSSSQGWLSR
jgi:hypothetical protein